MPSLAGTAVLSSWRQAGVEDALWGVQNEPGAGCRELGTSTIPCPVLVRMLSVIFVSELD